MAHYNFTKDLEASHAGVKQLAEVLTYKWNCTDIQENHDYKYDLSFKMKDARHTMEVKEDLMYEKTGNIAVELMSRGKKSGINKSEADMWCYKLGEEYWCIATSVLERLVEKARIVHGGDNGTSKIALVKVSAFKQAAKNIS